MDVNQLLNADEVAATKTFYLNYVQSSPAHKKIKGFLSREEVFHDAFNIYPFYPLLFRPYFPDIPRQQLHQLATAGYLYYLSLVSLDRIIDKKSKAFDPGNLAIIFYCQEETIKLLTHLFGADHAELWKVWNTRKEEQQYGLVLEQQLDYNAKVSPEQYEQLAVAKSAVAKVAIDASFLLNGDGREKDYQKILEAHDLFSIGLQIIDDLQDLDKDVEDNQYNIGFEYLREICAKDSTSVEDLIQKKECKKYLYFRNGVEALLDKAATYFTRAEQIMEGYPESGWTKLVAASLLDTNLKMDRTKGFFQILNHRHQKMQAPPAHQEVIAPVLETLSDLPPLIKNGLTFLLKQWSRSFPDLTHIMFLSKYEGFGKDQGLYIGDVFPRAILADILCDVKEVWNLPLEGILEKEKAFLLRLRNEEDAIGGWRYFKDLLEIAPDIDDLGQLIQFFTRIGANDILEKYCRPPVDIALANNIQENGGIETWIIPKHNRTPMQQTQVRFNEERWGTGPDVEVVANFLYGLALWDAQTYRETLHAGIQYLLQQQHPRGFWSSRWYYGPYYGTYTCLRLISQVPELMPDVPMLMEKASNFLLKQQNKDGGWSGTGRPVSDPHNTALALLCLNELQPERLPKLKKEALHFLKSTQREDGSWPGVDFIKPRVDEPYRSAVLTSAYVVKALSSVRSAFPYAADWRR